MKVVKQTIRKIVSYLNNADEEGGFWLPNIQRPFVWSEKQIYKLFDSILREYPISTFLIWKSTSEILHRKFIDNWHDSLRISDFNMPTNKKKKCLVLDGQQRLQALFIGLCGSYEGKELYFDILSGDASAPDDIKYNFFFSEKTSTSFPQVLFKDLVFTTKKPRELLDSITASAKRELTTTDSDRIQDNLNLIDRTFKMDDAVTYQELDSIDNPLLYKEDDVVEVFIRANSGGTQLSKSDLLFSLLSSSWDEANKRMELLLESLNKHGFKFDRDFVLKACLLLLEQGARYEVEKFRREGVRENIEEHWEEIAGAIQDVLDFVRGKTYIQCDKTLPSYLVLIPLVYLRYHFSSAWETAQSKDEYILRCSLTGAFGGVPDRLLDGLVKEIASRRDFDLAAIFEVIKSQGRSLELTEDRLFQMGYGSDSIHLLFNLWYRDFNYTPAYDNNQPQVDHIFPRSKLAEIKVTNPKTGRKVMKYHDAERNHLANCMLLTKDENGSGGKSDTPPDVWFADKDSAYLDRHLIPHDPELWRMDRFEDFILARKKLILERFSDLLAGPAVSQTKGEENAEA